MVEIANRPNICEVIPNHWHDWNSLNTIPPVVPENVTQTYYKELSEIVASRITLESRCRELEKGIRSLGAQCPPELQRAVELIGQSSNCKQSSSMATPQSISPNRIESEVPNIQIPSHAMTTQQSNVLNISPSTPARNDQQLGCSKTVSFDDVRSVIKAPRKKQVKEQNHGTTYADGGSTTEWEGITLSDDEVTEDEPETIVTNVPQQTLVYAQQPSFKQMMYKTDDIHEWFRIFEKIASANGWSLSIMAKQAPTNFHGVVDDIWNLLSAEKKTDYTSMKVHMLKKMKGPGTESQNILEYYSIKQMIGESATEFANRIKKIIEKTPSLKLQNENQVAKHFVRCSRPDIRQSICNMKFKHIDHAVKCAERADISNYDRENSQSSIVNAIDRHLRFDDSSLIQNRSNQTNEVYRDRTPSPRRNFQKYQQYKGYTCLNCNSADHLVASCPSVDRTRLCDYCGKIGHHEAICTDKYLATIRKEQNLKKGNALASRMETSRSELQSPTTAI